MNRVLALGSKIASTLAVVALAIGLLAGPTNAAKADEDTVDAVAIGICYGSLSNCVNSWKICPPFFTCLYDSTIPGCDCF